MFATESNDNESIFWRTVKEKIIKTEMKIQPYHGEVLLKVFEIKIFAAKVHPIDKTRETLSKLTLFLQDKAVLNCSL